MVTDISTGWMIVLIAVIIWELCWKGFALWRASRRNEPVWFIALLVINTVGILPIAYLFFTRSKS